MLSQQDVQLIAELSSAVASINIDKVTSLIKNVKTMQCDARVAAARVLWVSLGNVPINDNHELDEDWLMFSEFDDLNDIWRWFERVFDISVGDDLMYSE
jgi:hypothetical protein